MGGRLKRASRVSADAPMDAIGQRMANRVQALLEERPSLTRTILAHLTGRSEGFIGEFLTKLRMVNDLRFVLKLAEILNVPAMVLLDAAELDATATTLVPVASDSKTLTLLAAWPKITDPEDRKLVVDLVVNLSERRPGGRIDQTSAASAREIAGSTA